MPCRPSSTRSRSRAGARSPSASKSRASGATARLREKISTAVVVPDDELGEEGVVGFGSTVVVRDQHGAERTWTIVSSHDAAPAEGRLSVESPVARALAGRRGGEQVSVTLPRGEIVLTILSVS
jgi:transcription elongation factor GreB